MRTVTSSVLTIALFGPLVGISTAGQPDQREALNPFRSDQVNQESVQQELLIDDDSPAQGKPPGCGATKLAIGAIIPPTEGRFVAEGRCWYFVADFPEFAAVINPQQMPQPVNVFRAAATHSYETGSAGLRGNTATHPDAIDRPTNPLRQDNQGHRFAFDSDADSNHDPLPEKLMIADDLMLRRVIDRIGADQSGDRWIVSGEVVEEIGGASLMIHVADRSGSGLPRLIK